MQIIILIIINLSSARHWSGPCWCLCPRQSMPVNNPSSPCPVTTPILMCLLLITAAEEHWVKQDDSHSESHDLLLQHSEIPIWLHLELDLLGDFAHFNSMGPNFGFGWQGGKNNKGCVYIHGLGNAIDLDIITNIIAEISTSSLGSINQNFHLEIRNSTSENFK